MSRVWRYALPALFLLAFLGAWELYVELGGVDHLILPAPHEVAKALYTDRSLLWSNFFVTAKEVVLGLLVAVVAALALAVAMHFSQIVRTGLYPLLIASQAVPVVVLAPILIVWLGFGLGPKIVVVALTSFFAIVVTTLAGLASVDPDLIKLMRTFDAGRLRTFWRIEAPAALPAVLTGAKIAVVFSGLAAVFGEWAGANAGLGFVILQAEPQLLAARAVAAVVILSGFAIALFGLLTLAERVALPWAYPTRGDR